MAYGVKYRLTFADVLGNDKKLEISKDGYTGSVNDIVGTSNPVIVSWENDNDFYNPIIGSNCTINLKVTDDVQYDDFYKFNEQEYLVQVFYKDDSNNFQVYWQGYIVTDTYKQVVTTTPYDIQIKAYDLLGSLDGFDVTLTAGDSVRPLRSTSDPHDPTSSVPTKTLAQNITDCLANTGLAMDLYVSLNIDSNNILDQVEGNGVFKFTKNFDIENCKNYLTNILKCLNARLFQSYGRWYIINNSTYMDKYNIDNYSSIGSSRRLAATKHLQANQTETINFKTYNSSGTSTGTSDVDVLIDLKDDTNPINNDLLVEYLPPARKVEHNVSREMETILNNELILDPGFEITSTNTDDILWIDSAQSGLKEGTIGTYDIVNGGVRACRTSIFDTTDPVSIEVVVESKNTFIGALSGIKNQPPSLDPFERITLTWKIYIDGTIAAGEKVTFKYVLYRIKSDQESYNPSSQTWTSGSNIIEHEITETDKWVSFSLTFEPSSSVEEYYVEARTPKRESSSSLNYLYIDNVTIRRANKLDNLLYERLLSNNSVVKKQEYEGIVQNYNNYTGIVGNVASATQEQLNDFRTHLPRYEGTFYNKNNEPISMHNKFWINYSTTFVLGTTNDSNQTVTGTRIYTNSSTTNVNVGDYVYNYRSATNPITSAVKVTSINTSASPPYIQLDTSITYDVGEYFGFSKSELYNFGVSPDYHLHEPVPCIIDSLEYDVRQNTIKGVMHVPNQDDNVTNTQKIKTK